MPLNYNGTAMRKVNFNGSAAKRINRNGTLVYSAEETVATNLTASVYNYSVYATNGTNWRYGDTSRFSLADHDSVTINFSYKVTQAWSQGNGIYSVGGVWLILNDGTWISLGSNAGTLYEAGNHNYQVNGPRTVDISGYNNSQLSSCYIRIGIGDMRCWDGSYNNDRHDGNLTVSSVVAF